MSNLRIWEDVRTVPETAKKRIPAYCLRFHLTSINVANKKRQVIDPCGAAGTTTSRKRTVDGADGQIVAIVDINLFVKIDGEWSKPMQELADQCLLPKKNEPYIR